MEKVKKIALSYYSRKDVLLYIYKFAQYRETIPRYEDSFGKRPDSPQYESDLFEYVKNGATSFHVSEEHWHDPLKINTDMAQNEINDLRKGWDLLIDIDSKYFEYSRIAANLIVKALEFYGVKNIGIKFSVTGDTIILIKNKNKISLIPISEAIDLVKKGIELETLSLDKDKKLRFSKIYDYLEHEDEIFELLYEHSRIPLKVTQHHSVFIFEDGRIIPKKISEIKKRDLLVTFNAKNNPIVSQKDKIINQFRFGKNQYIKDDITKEVTLTKELMRLMGYYLSEGHVTNILNQVGFTFNQNEKNYIEDCIKLLKDITNKNISIRHPNQGSTQILIHSKEWSTFFEKYCGRGKEKHVPEFTWTLSKELFLEMLLGYIRGDGYKIGEYGIVVKSVALQLIREFVWLCKLNGISCSLSTEQNKPHKMPQGNIFKGSFVYILKIPKSELDSIEFFRKRNKFSPYPQDRTFPVDSLKKVYYQIKPKRFKQHRVEESTLNKKRANAERIKKVLEWFQEYKSEEFTQESKDIINNYKYLINGDIGSIEVKSIKSIGKNKVYDVSVKDTESFFGNDYPILLHNSGSKGMHIIVPWAAFPQELAGLKTKDMFPEWARAISLYLTDFIKNQLTKEIGKIYSNKYVIDEEAPKEVMPDIVLVAPRHLFRAPYSLHEKTALASIVIDKNNIESFDMKDADPLKVVIKDFYPQAEKDEAKFLLEQALDWYKFQKKPQKEHSKPLEVIDNKFITEDMFPPVIKNILKGVKQDGRKRALFILISFFNSLNFSFDYIEKTIQEWNKKNYKPLKEGYIRTQIEWSRKNKKLLPPNFDSDYYKAIGVYELDDLAEKTKNPVTYVLAKARARMKNK